MTLAICNSNFRALVQAAKDQGWVITQTRRLHWRFVPPDKDKPACIASGTPSSKREYQNLRTALRRSGLRV
jgi:hypothetical protein